MEGKINGDRLTNTKKQSATTDAEGLNEGIGCMPMIGLVPTDEDRYGSTSIGVRVNDGIEVNVGSFGLTKEGRRLDRCELTRKKNRRLDRRCRHVLPMRRESPTLENDRAMLSTKH